MPTGPIGQHADATTLAVSVRTAWAAVEESGVPGQVQELAFSEVLRSLLETNSRRACDTEQTESQLSPTETAGRGYNAYVEASHSNPSEVDIFQKVSAETGVGLDKLEQTFHVDDGVVKLIGQHTKYGSNTADRARTVARIVTVVRKLGMGHNTTSFAVIKDACESKHCYDSKNFAHKHLKDMDGFVVKGEGKNRRLEPRGNGVSAFSDLIDRVLGIT